MRNMKRLATVVLGIGLLAMLTACKGDPNVKKQKYLESGNRYAEKQQFKEAVIQYQNAIQVDPGFEPAHYKLSQAYIAIGNYQGAFSELKKSVELKPDDLQAQVGLGNL